MKARSSKRAMRLNFASDVRRRVWERDGARCILCGNLNAFPEAHFIPRSRGGLGVEENCVTLCRRCHDRFDRGGREERESLRAVLREYLSGKYENWNEQNLYYKKE